ncbi:hypothetical protein [Butyrivibrio sp. VCD2006]|uniref:hypothetical protein n=1 Tax=Butyrivibrio sp. VCD2006 TaxID=1280664 RepID=UPI000410707D|nr:hypothetical protein [Butyrivibrio sp. VCD2006]
MRVKKLISLICVITITAFLGGRIHGLASAGAGAALEKIVEGEEASDEGSVEESKNGGMKKLPESLSCSFIVPEGFHASEDEPGVYLNEYYPLESANISYSVSKLPQDRVLTNAQKAAGESPDAGNVEFKYDELTGEMYETIQKENYEALYGANIGFTLESFENKDFDGFPGYLIKTSFTPEGSQTIHQISAIVLSKNKVYTIVYSRADDDDFEDVINESISTIHVLPKG